MKANWKWALMGVAALAFVACNENQPINPDDDDPQGGDYVKPISASDGVLSDWDALDKDYVFEAVCPGDAALLGLKSVKVYADPVYIFIQVEPDYEVIEDFAWVPFHIYLNTDNSDETGGYADQFLDANTDILMEGAVFAWDYEAAPNGPASPDEAAIAYGPGVFKWWGAVGGSGWEWTNPEEEATADNKWGAIIGEGELNGTTSQCVNGKIEIEILRELVPSDAGWNADEFGIGFDIQQAWSSVGILPCASATDENPSGHAAKLQVKIKK